MDDLYTLLGRVQPGSIVLDLGCGRGSFQYEKCRGRIVALDVMLPDSTARRSEGTYLLADSGAIPFRDASVDVVVSHHTMEHFPDYRRTLEEIRRILSPHGWIWIAIPNGFGFDDAFYRFAFAGGGHVNRFNYASLVQDVERITGTHFIRSADLFSSFIYVQDKGARVFAEMPPGFLTFFAFALNAGTRLMDKLFHTRYSQYGWAFVFAREPMSLGPMPSYFNVCRGCGAGHASENLMKQMKHSIFGLGFYRCPACGERNVFVQPPANLQ